MLKYIFLSLILCLSSCAVTNTFGVSSQDSKNIEPAAIKNIGRAWSNNSINTTIYRHNGIVTFKGVTYVAFFYNQNTIRVIKLIKGDKDYALFDIVGVYDLSDTHNAISIGVDKEGFLHISYGQHASKLKYKKSLKPHDISLWSDELSMTDIRENLVTYPIFITPDLADKKNINGLLFVYRDGYSAKGDVCIKEYDIKVKKWRDIEPCVLVGKGQSPWASNAYLNHPVVDKKGNIHFSYVWRTHFLGPKKVLNNIGVDYAMSPDWGKSWRTSLGIKYRLPITQVNSETVYAVSPGNNLINQTSSAVDTENHPHIVYYANDYNGVPQYQHVWFDGKKWHHSFLSSRAKSFLLHGAGSLDIPISRPEVLIDNSNRLYLIYRGDISKNKIAVTRFLPPNYDMSSASTRILWDKSVGYAEPIIDRKRWESDRILSMYIQKSGPASNRDVTNTFQEEAYIVDWDLINDWQ